MSAEQLPKGFMCLEIASSQGHKHDEGRCLFYGIGGSWILTLCVIKYVRKKPNHFKLNEQDEVFPPVKEGLLLSSK